MRRQVLRQPSAVPRSAAIVFAVVEGGDGVWRTAFDLAAPRLLMIALKDFYWEKTGGTWRNCPLGEGMVDWKRYFAMIANARFHGPVSLHVEYEVPGIEPLLLARVFVDHPAVASPRPAS